MGTIRLRRVTGQAAESLDYQVVDYDPACEQFLSVPCPDLRGSWLRRLVSQASPNSLFRCSCWEELIHGRENGAVDCWLDPPGVRCWVIVARVNPSDVLVVFSPAPSRSGEPFISQTDLVLLDGLIEHIPDPVCIVDADDRFVLNNRAHLQLLGMDNQEDVTGKTVQDFFPPEDATGYLATSWAVRQSNSILLNQEERVTDPRTGKFRWFLVNKFPVPGRGGELGWVAAILRDITSLKESEQREHYLKRVILAIRNINQLIVHEDDPHRLIQRACENLTATLGHHNAWIVLYDRDGRVAGTGSSGFDGGFEVLRAQLMAGVYPSCVRQALEREGAVVIADPSSECSACPVMRKYRYRAGLSCRLQYGGRVFGVLVVSASVSYVTDREAHDLFFELAGDLGYALDQIESAEELRVTRERYRLLVDNAGEGIALIQGDQVVFANPTLTEITGHDQKTLLVTPFIEHVHPDDREKAMETARTVLAGEEKLVRFPLRIYTKNREIRWVEMNTVPFNWKGQPALLAFIDDITDRKQGEERLKASESRVKRKLESILSPTGDIGHLELADILDTEAIQAILDDFHELHGVGVGLQDLEGRYLAASVRQEMCDRFHRVHPETSRFCWESDTELSRGVAPGEVKAYRCKNHMWDLVTPIIVGGKHLGNLFMGQFFYDDEPLDYRLFQVQARRYGFDEARYIAALGRVPRFSRERIDIMIHFLAQFAQLISTLSYRNLFLARTVSERDSLLESLGVSEQRYRHLSFHDTLTGLYNRSFIEEELHRLSDSVLLPLGVVLYDINGLKLVNDAFGHQTGDLLLQRFAGVLNQSCRKEDMVGRWGGDEFILLVPGTDEHSLQQMTEQILAQGRDVSTGQIPLSVSAGWSIMTEYGQSIDPAIALAEERMYRNKLTESRSARSSILASLERTLRETTMETQEHAFRMSVLVRKLGEALDLSADELDDLELLARLHDVGKVAIPQDILNKPDPLNPEEWETVKKHPEIGYRIAQSSADLLPIAEAILAHHERWDGTGYPQGLKGEAISLLSRITSVIDAFDVMTSGRPYKKAMGAVEAIRELKRCAGSQFDPRVVEVFVRLVEAGE